MSRGRRPAPACGLILCFQTVRGQIRASVAISSRPRRLSRYVTRGSESPRVPRGTPYPGSAWALELEP
ncbi:hypothetical protein HBNXHx_2178 [Haloferax volcanii]|nr:hypothetical protein HBNXHx_2178 [Haloferax alexandrinus]